jgi:hypothetical protein
MKPDAIPRVVPLQDMRSLFLILWSLVLACSAGSRQATEDGGTTSSPSTPGGDDGGGAGGDDGGLVTCQSDPRVDTYVANLTKASTSGALKVTLVSSDPAPPAKGSNTWIIRAADGSGAPMTNAPLTVTPFMPDHGHGSSVVATITPQADGSYNVAPLYLFMPGVWRITFTLPATDAGAAQSVDFFFCISG